MRTLTLFAALAVSLALAGQSRACGHVQAFVAPVVVSPVILTQVVQPVVAVQAFVAPVHVQPVVAAVQVQRVAVVRQKVVVERQVVRSRVVIRGH